MRDLPKSMGMQVSILDPLVTQAIFNKERIVGKISKFFEVVDISTCNFIIYPYVEVLVSLSTYLLQWIFFSNSLLIALLLVEAIGV